MTFPAGLRSLNHRDFRLFWLGLLVSQIGTWMQMVGQAWLVLEISRSPLRLGLISTLQFAPLLLLSLFAGAVADRVPKRRWIICTQMVLMLPAFALAYLVWSEQIQYWHVAVLATLLGTGNALDLPARQSFMVDLVGKPDLLNAIALNVAVFNGARIIGPALSGLIIARHGVGLAFFLNGLSFLAVLAALLLMRTPGLPHSRRENSILAEVRVGVTFVLHTPLVLLALTLLWAVSLFAINHNVLVPLLARDVLQEGAHGLGLLMSALGAGALCGALLLATRQQHRPRLATVVGFAALLSGAVIALAAARQFWPAAAALFVAGLAQAVFTASCNTLLQLTAPDELRGRVLSMYVLVFGGAAPLGAFLSGAVSEAWGVSVGLFAGGVAALLAVVGLSLAWRAWGRRRN